MPLEFHRPVTRRMVQDSWRKPFERATMINSGTGSAVEGLLALNPATPRSFWGVVMASPQPSGIRHSEQNVVTETCPTPMSNHDVANDENLAAVESPHEMNQQPMPTFASVPIQASSNPILPSPLSNAERVYPPKLSSIKIPPLNFPPLPIQALPPKAMEPPATSPVSIFPGESSHPFSLPPLRTPSRPSLNTPHIAKPTALRDSAEDPICQAEVAQNASEYGTSMGTLRAPLPPVTCAPLVSAVLAKPVVLTDGERGVNEVHPAQHRPVAEPVPVAKRQKKSEPPLAFETPVCDLAVSRAPSPSHSAEPTALSTSVKRSRALTRSTSASFPSTRVPKRRASSSGDAATEEGQTPKRSRKGKLKSLKCPLCDVRFHQQSARRSHVRTVHDGERRFSCLECTQRFGASGDVTRHVQSVHRRERPHACGVCQLRFGRKSVLDRHRRNVHRDD